MNAVIGSRRPMAIDLFCGLLQTKFLGRANLAVKQLMARRAKHPNHVTSTIRHQPAGTVALVRWFVRDFNYTLFATRFACRREVRIFPFQARQATVFIRASRIINCLCFRIAAMERTPLYAAGLRRAFGRAVACVSARRGYLKVLAARPAVTPTFRDVCLLMAPKSSGAGLAFWGAIPFIRPNSVKRSAAQRTEQVVHFESIA